MVKFTTKNPKPSGLEMTEESRALGVVAENLVWFPPETPPGSKLPVMPVPEHQVNSSILCGPLYSQGTNTYTQAHT